MVSLVTRAGGRVGGGSINQTTVAVVVEEKKVKGFWCRWEFVAEWTEVGDYTSDESRGFVNSCGGIFGLRE
jgi:hypothetical protein